MTLLNNSFEGGSNTTAVSSANSGGASGNAWDTVTIGSGATLAYDNTHVAHGTLACKLATSATSAQSFFYWGTSLAGPFTTVWFREYLYFTANPSTSIRLWSAWNTSSAGTLCGGVNLSSAGKLVFVNGAATTVLTTTNSVPLNQWFRVEGFLTGNASTGQMEVKLFSSMDSTTATETQTSSAAQATTGTISSAGFGTNAAQANVGPYWLDDLGVSSTAYIGPVITASYVPGAARRIPSRTPALPPVRRYCAAVVPPQLDMPFPVTESRQWRQPRGMQPRRPHQFTVVPPQLNPPYPFAEIVQRRETWTRGFPRRGRQANVIPPQLNPPYPFSELRQWRQPRGFWPRRGHGFTPVPAQQAATPNPPWVPGALRHARAVLPVRRRLPVPVPAAQDMPLRRSTPRTRPVQPRRGHVMQAPQAQAPAIAPAWVQSHRGPMRAIAFIRRRFRQLLPWPQAVAPPFSVGTLTASGAPSGTLTASGASAALTAVTAPQASLTAADQKAGGPR